MILTLYILTMSLAVIQGISHEILYSRLGAGWAKWNEHIVFNIERIGWGILAGAGVVVGYLFTDIGNMIPKLVCYAAGSWMSFSFFHNGAYGMARAYRLKLPLLKGWLYVSSSDTARISLDFQSRLWWFVMGLLFIIIGQFVLV